MRFVFFILFKLSLTEKEQNIHIFFFKISDQGWNGYEDQDKIQWTFAGSLFYSIACITTIGYGDQTPKTQTGKFVTIIYCGKKIKSHKNPNFVVKNE